MTQLYEPTKAPGTKAALTLARRRLEQMDEIDGGERNADVATRLRTVLQMLCASLDAKPEGWTGIAEATALLQAIEADVRPNYYEGGKR